MTTKNQTLVDFESQAGASAGEPFVISIEIKTEVDDCPNFDYLNELASDDNVKLGVSCEPYAEEDRKLAKERLANYGVHWHYQHIYAQAEVAYQTSLGGYRPVTFDSAGLWGVSSDESDEYLDTIASEELSALHLHLGHFGVKGFAEANERREKNEQ